MVIPKFHFFQVKRKAFLGDTMELDESFLGEAPESFQAVDINLSSGKPLSMIDLEVSISAKHESVIAFEFIGIDDGSPLNHFDGFIQERLGGYVPDNRNPDLAATLQKAEYRDFAGRSSATSSLPLSTEIGFIQLDFPMQLGKIVGMLKDGISYQMSCVEGCWVTYADLPGDPSGRYLQFKELNDPEPLLRLQIQLTDPSAGEVLKCISTKGAPVSFTGDSIYFSALAPDTKSPFFAPAFSNKKQTAAIFAPS